jgi:hypothetical protein
MVRGLEFIDENGGGLGVRLRKRHQKKALGFAAGAKAMRYVKDARPSRFGASLLSRL